LRFSLIFRVVFGPLLRSIACSATALTKARIIPGPTKI
jgi:hypothetical protein